MAVEHQSPQGPECDLALHPAAPPRLALASWAQKTVARSTGLALVENCPLTAPGATHCRNQDRRGSAGRCRSETEPARGPRAPDICGFNIPTHTHTSNSLDRWRVALTFHHESLKEFMEPRPHCDDRGRARRCVQLLR